MRRRNRLQLNSSEDESPLDLTPMLDVVFIMLIFFIVTTSFVKESGIEIDRPTARSADRQEKGNVLVAISPEGEIWVDRRPVDLLAVGPLVERRLAESAGAVVIIQSDRKAPVGRLVQVMDQIRLAGVSNIALATEGGAP